MKYFFYSISFFLLIVSCQKNTTEGLLEGENKAYVLNIPDWAPKPNIPADNFLTEEKVALGKLLFHEKKLSKNNDLSCASCHLEDKAFAQNVALGKGNENKIGFRNSPSLINTAYQNNFFKDGGVKSLELQVFVPIETHFEFNLTVPQVINRLNESDFYIEAFQKVFGKKPDVFGLTRAIAAYERTLIDFSSKYDKVIFEKTETFTEEELLGYQLFQAKCASCHSGINFSDQKFHNIGLSINPNDLGRYRITRDSADIGKFKTPNLRNVAITYPYMHDGSLNTLEEVLDQYSNESGENLSGKLVSIQLTTEEKRQIISFLKTLTSSQYGN